MTNLGRFWLSVGAGVLFGTGGMLVVAIFGPLLSPLTLDGSHHPEDTVVSLMLGILVLFVLCGFLLGWKLTRRVVEDAQHQSLLELDSHDR